ncbi:type II secretion system protein [Patescibacteria group bacterium]|nr:type II secretion system protein [Patescibacteria group bacterium]
MKKGFTLVELLITTVIMGMLIGLLFEIFVLIARIAVKVEHERSVHNEIIYVMQTIQNLIDQGNIEFADYV